MTVATRAPSRFTHPAGAEGAGSAEPNDAKDAYQRAAGMDAPAGARERLLAAIAPDECFDRAEHLLRTAHRLAVAMDADWTVASIATPGFLGLVNPAQDSRIEVFRLAEALGAETVTIEAGFPPDAVKEYSRLRRVRTIIVGAPQKKPGWRLRRSMAHSLMSAGVDADVIVVSRETRDIDGFRGSASAKTEVNWSKWLTLYGAALGLTAACSAMTVPMLDHFDLVDMGMVYMLGATFAALRLGRGPAIVTSLANIAAFDYFNVPPRLSFVVTEPHYIVTFGVMLAVSIVIANLVSAVRRQTSAAAARESRTAALYAMSRELAVTVDAATMAAVAERHIADMGHSSVQVQIIDDGGLLKETNVPGRLAPDATICRWVVEHQQRAGMGTEPFGSELAVYLPLIGSQDVRGVLIVRPTDSRRALLPEQSRLLEALAGQLGSALERVRLVDVVQTAQLAAERAVLRNTLLASISHDLRTPLAAIAGAGSMMALDSFPMDGHRRTTLGRLIEDKARDMTELLSNVLELMRLENGVPSVKRDWHQLEDLIGMALRQNQAKLTDWPTRVEVPADLPMLFVAGGLVVQMLSNLLENCSKHTPAQTQIVIAAQVMESAVVISVEDDGPGFSAGDPERLFDKFERGRAESNIAGVGLGLAICRAVTRLHGGQIRALRVQSGGARFEIVLPLNAPPNHPVPVLQ